MPGPETGPLNSREETMRLSDLLKYDRIVIQCHNNPDPDALASGFGVWSYLKSQGKEAEFIYGGSEEISKPNLRLMISLFQIPIMHVTELRTPDLLVTADCQYGEANMQKFEAGAVAVIDHHEVTDQSRLPEMHRIMENYGSCATVVYEMLREEYPADHPLRLLSAEGGRELRLSDLDTDIEKILFTLLAEYSYLLA